MSEPATLVARPSGAAVPLVPLHESALAAWRAEQDETAAAWVTRSGFAAKAGKHCLVPDSKGGLAAVLVGVGREPEPWDFGALPQALPAGDYRLDGADARLSGHAALGWVLGSYRFTRYKKANGELARLVWPSGVDRAAVSRTARAVSLVRDLINTPACDMGPEELAEAAKALGKRHKAKVTVTSGAALLRANYPAIHAVGRAAVQEPRLIDLRWTGPEGETGPRITLVGKGVCFDSGGLDLKPASGMKLMKKDMGGAAHVLGLAGMIMDAGLPVRLRVMVPAVENAVSGASFRPLDVLKTRKGITVEVGNTDAEGRLVLCDALAEAVGESPDLLVDFATLTGAARVALGTDLPAMFCNHEDTAARLLGHGLALADPLWRMPLHRPYRPQLDSKVADINNISSGPYAGAITAALFLQEFVPDQVPWVHIDLMAWNLTGRPGRPEGGEAMGLRAVYALVEETARRPARRARKGRAK